MVRTAPVSAQTDPLMDRTPPHDDGAEECLLGSMMLDPDCIPQVLGIVNRSMMFHSDNAVMFDAICQMREDRKAIDAILLRTELERRGLLKEIGGVAFIGKILGSLPSAAHGLHYAGVVYERYARRMLIQVGRQLERRAFDPSEEGNGSEILQQGMAMLSNAVTQRRSAAQHIGRVLDEVRLGMTAGGVSIVPTGFRDVDEIAGGIGLGEVWLLGGRPSMGKSLCAKQSAVKVAKAGVSAAILSLEETTPKIGRNILAAECRIENHLIRRPIGFGERDWQRIDGGILRLRDIPLHVLSGRRRIHELHAELSRLVVAEGVQYVVIDYLQLINAGGRDRYEQATNASLSLTAMVKELNVACWAPVQLSRAAVNREDKRPTMTDLRESGQLEQDADGIVFIHREDYYHLDQSDYQPTGVAELIFAKMRDGVRGGTVKLKSNLKYQTFEDMDQIAPDPFAPKAKSSSFDPWTGDDLPPLE